MFEYSEKVMDHFINPRNVGELEDPDGVGRVGNPVCGDIMEFQIKVAPGLTGGERISDVKFRTFGCGAAIAVSSMVSEMAKGKTLDEAMKITNKMVAEELGGLPKNKFHCSNLGADALHKAIDDYREKQRKSIEEMETDKKTEERCRCPYCDVPVSAQAVFCGGCGTKLRFCSECGCAVPRVAERCPECGAKLKSTDEQRQEL